MSSQGNVVETGSVLSVSRRSSKQPIDILSLTQWYIISYDAIDISHILISHTIKSGTKATGSIGQFKLVQVSDKCHKHINTMYQRNSLIDTVIPWTLQSAVGENQR